MMNLPSKTTTAAACALAFSLEVLAIVGWMRTKPPAAPFLPAIVQAPLSSELPFVEAQQEAAVPEQTAQREDSYYAQLRSKIHWVETRIGNVTCCAE